MSTLRRIYIPLLTYRIESREDAISHKAISVQVPSKKLLHGCRLDYPDCLLPLRLLFLDAFLPLGVGGSEGGAAFGVGFGARS